MRLHTVPRPRLVGACISLAAVCLTFLLLPAAPPAAVHSARISYFIPPKTSIYLQDNPFHVGDNVTAKNISFCWPKPKPGRFCGGGFSKGTLDPAGGTPGESYDFFEKGFLPSGLFINFKNGNLQGTVKPQLNRVWKFEVCAYQPHGAGKSHARCAPTAISIVGAYDGDWSGTLTGTYTYTTPYEHDVVPIDDDLSFTVKDGTFDQDGTGTYVTTIGPNGNATITEVFSDQLTCTFQIQFYTDGTASSGQTLSCQNTDSESNGNYVSSFGGGAIHLKRTS